MRVENTVSRRSGTLMTKAAAAVLAGASSLSAQADLPSCPWNPSTVIPGTHYTVGAIHHGLAFAPSKLAGKHTTWSLLRDTNASRLFLRRSDDGGCTAFETTDYQLRTLNQGGGCMVMGNDCKTLHILFDGLNPSGYASVYYDAWDTTIPGWIGAGPQVIAQGLSTNFQYGVQDIEATAKGRIVISYYCAEPNGAGQPWFTAWWSSVLRVAEPPAECTQAVFPRAGYRINEVPTDPLGASFGVNLHAVGECVHVAFHAPQTAALSKVYYRGFDANALSWKQAGKVSLPVEAEEAAVVSSITTDDDCSTCEYKIYILFASHHGGGGNLWITCADNAAVPVFSLACPVDVDAPIQAGQNWQHFTLADGPNREVYAVYSKWSESFRNLYAKTYVGGCSGAELRCDVELTTVSNRFRAVIGSRSSLVMSNPYVTISDTQSVWLYRQDNTARTVSFGRYIGTRPSVPRLTAINAPTDGDTLCVTVCDVPANLPGVLCIGLTCTPEWALPLPFDPGSYFKQDVLATIGYTTTPCTGGGHWQTCFPINGVIKGQSIYMQAVQIYDFTPTLVPSNSMAVIFDVP